MYTKIHNVWPTVNISIESIFMLNIRCVVLIIYTKTPSTWQPVYFGIASIIMLTINCVLVKPLSHGVFQATYICCRLTRWPSTQLGCFKLHDEYAMSSPRRKPPIVTSVYEDLETLPEWVKSGRSLAQIRIKRNTWGYEHSLYINL